MPYVSQALRAELSWAQQSPQIRPFALFFVWGGAGEECGVRWDMGISCALRSISDFWGLRPSHALACAIMQALCGIWGCAVF